MDLKTLTNEELLSLVSKTTDKDALREIATFLDVSFSGNTGMETLTNKLVARLKEIIAEEAEDLDELPEEELDANDPVAAALLAQIASKDKEEDVHVAEVKVRYTIEEMLEMDASKVKDDILRRQVIKAQALRLSRVRIRNLDPDDAMVPSTLVTCYSKYTGKVSKVIPHDDEFYVNGYQVPQIILDDLETRTFNMRKEIKSNGRSFGVKQYKTIPTKKFSIEYLPQLTEAQLKALAASQEARGAIDHSE